MYNPSAGYSLDSKKIQMLKLMWGPASENKALLFF